MYSFWKKGFLVAMESAILVLLGIFLYHMQTVLSLGRLTADMERERENIIPYLEAIQDTEADVILDYDTVYQSKAETLAYMAQREIHGKLDVSRLKEYAKLLEVERVFIIGRNGDIRLKTADTGADFHYVRYAQLLAAFSSDSPSEAFFVDTGAGCYRYYGARIDASRMAVLEIPAQELENKIEKVSSWKAVLENIQVGLKGFAFSVSKKDYTFLYYPDETMIGQDSIYAGIEVEQLKDGNYCWMRVGGNRLYCAVWETDDAYVVCATEEAELASSCRITVLIVLFIVFIVITVMLAYAFFISGEDDETGNALYGRIGMLIYNRKIVGKVGLVSLFGVGAIFIMSLFMQTLFLYSNYSVSCNQRVSEVEEIIGQYEAEIEEFEQEYNDIYLNKCRAASYIVESGSVEPTWKELEKICDVLDAWYLYVYDETGAVIHTNSPNYRFRLSDDPEDQSYVFTGLLRSKEYVIQEPGLDDSGDYMQYVGVSIRNEENRPTGLVQIGIHPQALERKLETIDISSILKEISVGNNGFAFAVNKEEHTFAYFPDKKYIGANAEEYGVTPEMWKDKFNGDIRINYTDYYGASLETAEYYIYVVVPKSEITGTQLPIAIVSTAVSFLCLGVMMVLLLFQGTGSVPEAGRQPGTGGKKLRQVCRRLHLPHAEEKKNEQMVSVFMPDGSVKKTEAAASRWDNMSVEWKNRTAEQKVFTLLKGLIILLDLLIVAAFFLWQGIAETNPVLYYILSGNWERKANIFAVTSCVMIVCLISAIAGMIRGGLKILSHAMTARGETICRLLGSTLKYISIILEFYYCLAQFGVDTKTMLASAGILSLVIGLGAQDLIKDILAGLFIIFEGEFQVGDIVTVGDWRGTVLEIGMRTTKIEEEGNIKIINNSNISNVINMTRRVSFVVCRMRIGYEESLERVEGILEKELPLIRERIAEIDSGPVYNGVSSLEDSCIKLFIVAQCTETVRRKVERELNREIRLLCSRYDIQTPYPQVVIRQPDGQQGKNP